MPPKRLKQIEIYILRSSINSHTTEEPVKNVFPGMTAKCFKNEPKPFNTDVFVSKTSLPRASLGPNTHSIFGDIPGYNSRCASPFALRLCMADALCRVQIVEHARRPRKSIRNMLSRWAVMAAPFGGVIGDIADVRKR